MRLKRGRQVRLAIQPFVSSLHYYVHAENPSAGQYMIIF